MIDDERTMREVDRVTSISRVTPGTDVLAAWSVWVLAAAYVALWTLTGRYWGLQHDAQVYVAQALARGGSSPLAQDLFFRFRSQDEFTLFPTLAAPLIGWLGPERGAALLTLVATTAWLFFAWHLARRLFDARYAWLAVGWLLAIPAYYGGGAVFRTMEPFLSARPFAEAVGLAALAFSASNRFVPALLVAALACALHPLMAVPIVLMLVAIRFAGATTRRYWLLASAAIVVSGVAGALALGGWEAMSGGWLEWTRMRSRYLFPTVWTPADWQVNLLPLLTCLLAARLLAGSPAVLAKAAVGVGASGLILSIASDAIVPLPLLLQGQPWRWVWPAGVLAVMFLPATLHAAWRIPGAGRAVALLSGTAWLLVPWASTDALPPAGVSTLLLGLALLLLACEASVTPRLQRLASTGAVTAGTVACVGLMVTMIVVAGTPYGFGVDPEWIQRVTNLLVIPAVAVAWVTLAWFGLASRRPALVAAVGVVSAAVLVQGFSGTRTAWLDSAFDQSARDRFEPWRRIIDREAEVLWIDGLAETWFLLDRRSYLSVSQLGGIVFSRELADEAIRRAARLEPLVVPGYWVLDPAAPGRKPRELTAARLTEICAEGGPDFIVDTRDLGSASSRVEWPTRAQYRYLYDCRSVRSAGRLAPAS